MLPIPQAMGYIIVGARIDPHDWGELNGGAPPPDGHDRAARAARRDAGKGNIILMHDGGGDRANTVAALPQIIDGLARQRLRIRFRFGSAGTIARASDAAAFAPGMADGPRRRFHL